MENEEKTKSGKPVRFGAQLAAGNGGFSLSYDMTWHGRWLPDFRGFLALLPLQKRGQLEGLFHSMRKSKAIASEARGLG